MSKLRANKIISTVITFCIAVLFSLFSHGNVGAQNVDPQLLERLQRQAKDGAARQKTVSPVDESRNTSDIGGASKPNPIIQAVSVLERDFSARLAIQHINQFGYDIFEQPQAGTPPAVGRIADDYIFSIGDEVVAIFQGSEESIITTNVDSEGRLIIGKLPPIAAVGRAFSEVRREIEQRTEQTLLGTNVFLSVGAIKAINVQVVGEVQRPGSYKLTSLSDVFNALISSGGVKKTGSLRSIILLRSDQRVEIDLYSILSGSKNVDIKLQDGDRVIVPPIGDTIAIAGAVLAPAIFELPPEGAYATLAELVKLAGGTLRPNGNRFTLNRIDDDGAEVFSAVKDTHVRLQGGDAVNVFFDAGARKERVAISGHVHSPGARSLSSASTLEKLIVDLGTVKTDAYLPFAVLKRIDPETKAQTLEAVNLLPGQARQGFSLRNEDHLFVFGKEDIAFLTSSNVRDVVLGQSPDVKGCAALAYLGNLVSNVQSARYAGVLRGVFLVEKEGRAAVASLGNLEADASISGDGSSQTRLLKPDAADNRKCPLIFEGNLDILPFTLEHMVTISGGVRAPGALPVADQLSVHTLVQLSGGFSLDAETANIEIVELSSSDLNSNLQTNRSLIDGNPASLSNTYVKPGSSVRVQAVSDDQESGAVLLTGEFVRPGSYTIRRGETLSQLIARAGGATDVAYPYGAIFTRRSVQEAQQAGFRRAARELNAALATAALKDNVDADAVKAAQELSLSLASTEAPGRVVIEADPRVLVLRHDLDIVLEPGDTIFMPKRPGHVLAIGDVLNPGALQFIQGKAVSAYLAEAGGMQASADDERVFLVYPNGVAQPVRISAWRNSSIKIPPGSTIVVPKDTDPLATLDLTREITTIASQLAISAASFAVVFNGR